MKRITYLIVAGALAISLSAGVAAGQTSTASASDQDKQKQKEYETQQKQKDFEAQKKLKTLTEEEQQKLKQAELEAKKKAISEKEIQKKIAEIEAEAVLKDRDALKYLEFDRAWKDYEDLSRHAGSLSRTRPMIVIPDEKLFNYSLPGPGIGDYYLYHDISRGGKPGSSWNYSRQVMEATFTNEFTMSAGSESNVNLSVTGDCAEGSISVQVIMPDGKQLSEVLLDENGSLNWRKSFEAGQDNGWKNGKWVFRIKAKDATGNFRISMTSD